MPFKRTCGKHNNYRPRRRGLQKPNGATKLLFGKSERSDLDAFTAEELKQIFDGMPQFELSQDILDNGVSMDEMSVVQRQFANRNPMRDEH